MPLALDLVDLEYIDNNNLTKAQRRQLRKKKKQNRPPVLIDLERIEPKTENQEVAFDYFSDGDNLLLHGVAGTGKTFVSLYLALDDVFNGDDLKRDVTIVRSVVPTRDVGFLPGNEKEKTAIYEQPYEEICNELMNRKDGYKILKNRDIVRFTTTSFIRGLTFDNSIIVVDECQNMTFHELDSIITRAGENTRIIFCGDFRQTDLTKPHDQSGIKEFMKILKSMDYFSSVEFDYDDIVRSGLVKEYIMAKDKFNEIQSRKAARA